LHSIAFAQEQLGRFDKAIPLYKEILTIDPNHYAALNNLGVIYEKVGEYKTAAQHYGQLLELNSSNTSILKDALRALVAAGHFEDAQTNLESFARANSDDTDEAMSKVISDEYEKIQAAKLKLQNEN
jgi:Flp pilus assembly protein TadD